jgi:hypothetical protein
MYFIDYNSNYTQCIGISITHKIPKKNYVLFLCDLDLSCCDLDFLFSIFSSSTKFT